MIKLIWCEQSQLSDELLNWAHSIRRPASTVKEEQTRAYAVTPLPTPLYPAWFSLHAVEIIKYMGIKNTAEH